jgi:magnesium transporter
MLGVVLGLALVINMFVAGAVGTAIPVILKRAGVDPAVASGILVTAFTDSCGFFTFLGLASLALRYFHM